jgi:MoaA/NifB/PqqE/SkfB family radical SAM enzyme
MEIAKNYGIPTVVYTNGSLLRSYSHREVLSWNLDTIVVSVDGVDADSYERIKIGGKYAWLRDAVMEFYACRNSSGSRIPIIEIRHVIMPEETAGQLLQFRRTWLKTADTVKFNHLEPATGLYEFENPARPRCRGIRRETGIWWDGTMPLCPGYWRDYLGNVQNMSIFERWRHPKMEYMRQCHERRDFAQVPACIKCPKHI